MLIEDVEFEYVSNWLPLTVPDSFVVPDSKVQGGHGEAKFYIGGKNNPSLRSFFGDDGFSINALFVKQNLVQFLEDIKFEYINPTQPYFQAAALPRLWSERMEAVSDLKSEYIFFECSEQRAGGGRCYIKSSQNSPFKLIRELPLPNRASVLIEKYCSEEGQQRFIFSLRYSVGTLEERLLIGELEIARLVKSKNLASANIQQLSLSRFGSGRYRELLFASCGAHCPLSGVKDERLLCATHIKPWIHSNNDERLNPQNGLVLDPTFARLFEEGLITFAEDGRIRISTTLLPMMTGDLEISETPLFQPPLFGVENAGRRKFLEYHRRNIFIP